MRIGGMSLTFLGFILLIVLSVIELIWGFYWTSYKSVNTYLILFFAITFEVLGTMLLPVSQNFTKIIPTLVLSASYILSIYLLAIVSQKLPLSVVYSSWSGIGIFSIAILSYIFYKQTLNWQSILGLFLIVIGVTVVNIFKS